MTDITVIEAPAKAKERILFETRPMMLPAMMTFEILSLLGIIFVAGLVAVFFRLGFYELLIIGVLWAIVAFPAFRAVFDTGSTTYVLTNRRLVVFSASFRKTEQSYPLEQILSANCKFSGLQRFYGAGDIVLLRKGLKKPVRLRAMPNCKQYAKQITQAIKNAS